MNNQEFYRLFKDSKLAQVAKPLSKNLRGSKKIPTHQLIYTPKSSAIRSNFGIKTTLPKQVGFSHIVYNDLDNKKNMPDVEKYSGPFYTRVKFQEMGIPVRTESGENPLFKSESTKTPTNAKEADNISKDSVAFGLNLKSSSPSKKVQKILKQNPDLYKKFNEFMLKNHPDKLISNVTKNERKLVNEFLLSSTDLVKANTSLFSDKKENRVQGTGGFSYLQKGRLTNTPNGVKYGTVAPGRLVSSRDAAIGGFIASITDNSSLQRNYTMNYPGKHQRQFVLPFKVTDVELHPSGKVRVEANPVETGSWSDSMRENDSLYQPSNTGIRGASERLATNTSLLSSLLSVLETK